jgi:hypothetical protein
VARGARAGALASTLCAAPVLFVATLHTLAMRCAVVLAARGLRAEKAVAHGYDLVLRRLPGLLWFTVASAAVVAPLLALGALAAARGAFGAALAAALTTLAALAAYAGLSAWVGRDPRLATG